jgi:hypothetical protein
VYSGEKEKCTPYPADIDIGILFSRPEIYLGWTIGDVPKIHPEAGTVGSGHSLCR